MKSVVGRIERKLGLRVAAGLVRPVHLGPSLQKAVERFDIRAIQTRKEWHGLAHEVALRRDAAGDGSLEAIDGPAPDPGFRIDVLARVGARARRRRCRPDRC